MEAFHLRKLKDVEITPEEYEEVKRIYSDNNMSSMQALLRLYNNSDVEGFLDAIDKLVEFWSEWGIDALKSELIVPLVRLVLTFREFQVDRSAYPD